MSDYGERYGEFKRSGIEVVALTPEGPRQARRMRTRLKLPFTVLSDKRCDAARAFGLLENDPGSKSPTPATLVLDAQRQVRLSALNSGIKSVLAQDMLEYTRGLKVERPLAAQLAPVTLKPGRLFFQALANLVTSVVRGG